MYGKLLSFLNLGIEGFRRFSRLRKRRTVEFKFTLITGRGDLCHTPQAGQEMVKKELGVVWMAT